MKICFGLKVGGSPTSPQPSRLRRPCVYSHNQEMARKYTWQFISKFSTSSLPLKSQAAQTLFVIYIRDSIKVKRMESKPEKVQIVKMALERL